MESWYEALIDGTHSNVIQTDHVKQKYINNSYE